jgi:hypothetical protein
MPTHARTNPHATQPLTRPADLLMLFGRYIASLILLVFTLIHILQQNVGGAVFTGLASLFLLWTTFLLWRRLRNERMAAKAARDAASQHASRETIR